MRHRLFSPEKIAAGGAGGNEFLLALGNFIQLNGFRWGGGDMIRFYILALLCRFSNIGRRQGCHMRIPG